MENVNFDVAQIGRSPTGGDFYWEGLAMNLIFVHGRSQQRRSSSEIQTEWLTALNIGLAKCGMPKITTQPTVPFYGDELEKLVDSVDEGFRSDRMQRAPADARYRQFLGEIAAEAGQRSPINDDQLARHGFKPRGSAPPIGGRPGDRELRGTDPQDRVVRSADREERGPQNWEWVQAIIRALDENFPDLSAGGPELILRDVYLYCTDATLAAKIDKIVSAALDKQPSVIVGHSLGSVVAYNVLQAAATPVKLYVTVGSPLAMNAIKTRLKVSPIMPPHVMDWYNARDPADIVALNPLTFANFPTKPAINNNDGVNNTSDNRHHIAKYLDDMNVARVIGVALAK